jgi:pilus assembly protein CpaE
MRYRILLISSEAAIAERLKTALHPDALVMPVDPVAGDTAHMAEQFQPDGIVFDGDSQFGVHTLFERASSARKIFPGLPMIVIGNEMSAQLVLAAMRAGADDFLDNESSASEMRALILGRLESGAAQRRTGTETAEGMLVGILTAAGAEEDQDFALNFASLLAAKRTAGRVLLVDLSLPASIAAVALGIAVKFSLHDAIHAMTRLDRALLDSVLAKCPRSGLFVLPLAPQAESTETALDVQDVQALLQILRRMFDAVVVFYGPFSRQDTLIDAAHSDARFFVCSNQRLTSVKAASEWLRRLREARPGGPAPLAVIHEFVPELAPGAGALRAALGGGDCIIVDAPWRDLTAAVNRGVPLVLTGASSYTRRIAECIARLDPASATAPGRGPTAVKPEERKSTDWLSFWPFVQKKRA